MTFVIGLIFFIFFPAVIAWIVGTALDRLAPALRYAWRTVIAALAAGFVPMALPLIGVMIGSSMSNGEGTAIAVLALVFMALLIALVIGLPVALFTRRGKAAGDQSPGSTFD